VKAPPRTELSSVFVLVPARFRHLAPIQCELKRVGNLCDGGYVVAESSISDSQALVSLGIASEWSFDADFLKLKPKSEFVACDRGTGFLVHVVAAFRGIVRIREGGIHSILGSLKVAIRFLQLVPPRPFATRRKFIRKWVRASRVDPRRDCSFDEILSHLSCTHGVFVKMDIEGGEYEIIPEIIRMEAARSGLFTGLCIEFHEINARETEFLEKIQYLLRYFSIAHIHVNNCVPVTSDFPDVLEISFIPKRGTDVQERVTSLPVNGLDFPNDPSLADISLRFDV
jgi:hypothetical protein